MCCGWREIKSDKGFIGSVIKGIRQVMFICFMKRRLKESR